MWTHSSAQAECTTSQALWKMGLGNAGYDENLSDLPKTVIVLRASARAPRLKCKATNIFPESIHHLDTALLDTALPFIISLIALIQGTA